MDAAGEGNANADTVVFDGEAERGRIWEAREESRVEVLVDYVEDGETIGPLGRVVSLVSEG